ELRQILLSIHILLAIVWVGGVLFIGWGVYPASRKLAPQQQRIFLKSLMEWTHRLLTLAGIGVITTGILLGTAAGPLQSFHDIWHTTYGNIWVSALIISLLTLAWGIFVGYRHSLKVLGNDSLWMHAENGNHQPLTKAMLITAAVESVEV